MKKMLFGTLILVIGLFLGPLAHASEFNFAIQPEIPSNQLDRSVSYFDILLGKGQSQVLNIDLRNDTKQAVTVSVEVASATTNLNGVVEYSPNEIKPAASLTYNLAKQVTFPKEVTIAPDSTTQLPITVTMPDQEFNGVIAGGITLKEKKTGTTNSSSTEAGVAINNEFSYVVALLMRQNQTAVAADLKLNNVFADQVNYRNVITTALENPTATYINKVAVDGQIVKKGDQTALYTIHKDDMQIAPQSTFDLPISLDGEALEPGTYVAQLTVYGFLNADGQYQRTSGETTQHYQNRWQLEKEFTIAAKEASDLNQKDVTVAKATNWWLYALLLILILLILVVAYLLWLLWRRKKKERSE